MKITSTATLAMSLITSAAASATTVTINDVATSSGYELSSTSTTAEPQTHVIGVYETYSGHGGGYHPGGVAYVHVSGSSDTPINLVLSSYEPTTWVLDGAGVDSIGSLLINGYYASTVQGIDAAKLVNKTGLGNYLSACAYVWPGDNQGCDTQSLVLGVQSLYGSPITSFTGTYRATDFSVNIAAVPEAGSALYLMLGLPAAALVVRSRRRQQM